jgi:hypothetical protein
MGRGLSLWRFFWRGIKWFVTTQVTRVSNPSYLSSYNDFKIFTDNQEKN